MARGDVKFFASFFQKGLDGVSFNIDPTGSPADNDTLKLAIITSTGSPQAPAPTVSTNDPRWGVGGTVNFASFQCALGTAYTGPITLTNVVWTRTNGVITLDFDNVAIAQDAGGFTDGDWAIVYDDTVSGKYAVGFIDIGGPVSIVSGPLNINLNAGGFGTATAT